MVNTVWFVLVIKELTFIAVMCLMPFAFAHAEPTLIRSNDRFMLSGPCNEVSKEVQSLIAYKERIGEPMQNSPSLELNETCETDVTTLLPDLIKNLDGKDWQDGVGGYGNCHGQAAYFLGLTPVLIHDDVGQIEEFVRRSSYYFSDALQACEAVNYQDVKGGDLGVILSVIEDGRNLHSFTLTSENLAFSKNGHNGLGIPYKLRSLTEIADEYFQFYVSDDPKDGKINYYREGLKNGMDCVRGDRATKLRCVDAEYPVLSFFRCKSMAQLEIEHRSSLSKEYFALKAIIWEEGQSYIKSRGMILKPIGVPSALFLKTLKRIELVEKQLTKADTDPVNKFFWYQLRVTATNIKIFLDPKSEIRKVIFPRSKSEK